MNTMGLKKEIRTFSQKQILLTLKKNPGCFTTAVIAPIGKNQDGQITDKKLIKISSRDGCDTFLKEMHCLKSSHTVRQMPKKIPEDSMTNRKSLVIGNQSRILDNALVHGSEFGKKFNKILHERQKIDDKLNNNLNNTKPVVTDSRESKSKYLTLTLNKQNRFVPNILRTRKMTGNILSTNNRIGFNSIHSVISHRIDEHCKDRKNVKRQRKQVLNPLNIKHDWSKRARIQRKYHKFQQSLFRACNHNAAEVSQIASPRITAKKSEQGDINKCSEMEQESLNTAHEINKCSYGSNDIYAANLDIPCQTNNLCSEKQTDINCSVDKSIKKIFAEFEVADYQNYIDSNDLGFDIDEMDKLLSSDIDGSLTASAIFDHRTKTVEYDINGNDIDNYGNELEKLIDENDLKLNDIQCNMKPYYDDDEEESQINTSGRRICDIDLDEPEINVPGQLKVDINLDGTWSNTWDDGMSYKMSKLGWSTEFEDYYSSDDFQGFHHSYQKESSLTDTASEYKTNEYDQIQRSSLVSSKNEDPSLAISDIVPDKVFSDDFHESCSDCLASDDDTVKQAFDFNPMIPEHYVNSSYSNNNDYYISLPDVSNERLVTFELFDDGNFLVDDMLGIDCAISKEDETCESILANSNAKFDDKHIPNMHSDMSELDIENVDDIEISRLLSLHTNHTNVSSSVLDAATLQSDVLREPTNELRMFTASQLDMSQISITNQDNSQFGLFEFENPMQAQVENNLNESTYSNTSEGLEYSIGNEVETELQVCNIEDKNVMHVNSVLTTQSSKRDELLLPLDVEAKIIDRTQLTIPCSPPLLIEEENVNKSETSALESLLTQLQASVDCPSSNHSAAISGNVEKYQSSYSVCLEKSAPSDKLRNNLRKLKGDVWKGFIKRSQYVNRNISYIPCDFCEDRYSTEEAVADHIRVTHRYKPSRFRYRNKKYVCDKCSKEYSLAGAIEKHFKLHENYTLTCRVCEKHFSEKAYLRRHVYGFHLDWKLQCDYCSRKFPRKNELSRHLKSCHGLQGL